MAGPTWQWTNAFLNSDSLPLNIREPEYLDSAGYAGQGLRARLTNNYDGVIASSITCIVYKLKYLW